MNRQRLSPEEIARASALVGARCGLRFDAANHPLLAEGFERAALVENATASELLRRLEAAPTDALVQSLLRQLTIGETYLFRHPEHFSTVRDLCVPWLAETRQAERSVRAWSAGCATGEETWSLAATLGAALGEAWTVSVLGTDINRQALAGARRGSYRGWSVRAPLLPSSGLLQPGPDGSVDASPELRRMVRFDYLNLKDAVYPSLFTATQGLDVIFCRNVLVYFTAAAAKEVLLRLCDCLVDGGFLVVSALDIESAPPGLERVHTAGFTLLRRAPTSRTTAPNAKTKTGAGSGAGTGSGSGSGSKTGTGTKTGTTTPARANGASALVEGARAAADHGSLADAVTLAEEAVAQERSAETLHLLALFLGELGREEERVCLLDEVVRKSPADVLAHLGLGASALRDRRRRVAHLTRVLELTERRLEGERLPGPEPLPVSWVRKVASSALRQLQLREVGEP